MSENATQSGLARHKIKIVSQLVTSLKDSVLTPEECAWITARISSGAGAIAERRPIQKPLKSREVAEILGVTVRTVRNYSIRGILHPLAIGPRTRIARFDPAEVEKLVKAGEGSASISSQSV